MGWERQCLAHSTPSTPEQQPGEKKPTFAPGPSSQDAPLASKVSSGKLFSCPNLSFPSHKTEMTEYTSFLEGLSQGKYQVVDKALSTSDPHECPAQEWLSRWAVGRR